MEEVIWQTKIQVYAKDELLPMEKTLVTAAVAAAHKAYAPYSSFYVGAALRLADGRIVTGNNQENGAFPSGLCAERVALFAAGAGYPDIPVDAIAIVAFSEGKQVEGISPCGGCRQVLLETRNRHKKPLKVYLCGPEEVNVIEDAADLLPAGFTLP